MHSLFDFQSIFYAKKLKFVLILEKIEKSHYGLELKAKLKTDNCNIVVKLQVEARVTIQEIRNFAF